MGKDKKHFDEKLQELRTKNHETRRYLKRKQDEQEAEKQLKEYDRNIEDDPVQTIL